ncbi:hypothetical protein [Nonomuraea sp. KM90]|uniref:hypothetical protein n=1 Tax=Nonomuraea sp. KM90 TaxID=3457428 RepID=UPI003FCECEB4
MAGLGWIALGFSGADVRHVDPAVLPELRAVGRVVGEAADTAHEWQRQPPETWLRSSRWPHAFVAVERLKDMSHLSGELRRAVAATGLPMDEMVYMTVHE